jgi:hypothetical protein
MPKESVMALTIAPVTPSNTASTAQETAALNQLLTKYKYDVSHNSPASTLSSLGRQITADAKVVGQYVTLPRAPASASAAPATTVANTAAAPRTLDTTA